MKGRKPLPAHLKVVSGNPGRRPIKDAVEPEIVAPPCPEHLSGEARAEWGRIVPELMALRLLSQMDMAALAMYCQCYGRWQYAEQVIAKMNQESEDTGYVIASPNGFPVQSPWLNIANKAMEQCKSFLVEFGMSPSSRARIAPASAQMDLFGDEKKKTGNSYFS
jgi:P27 family predicted phage terminase small subunit